MGGWKTSCKAGTRPRSGCLFWAGKTIMLHGFSAAEVMRRWMKRKHFHCPPFALIYFCAVTEVTLPGESPNGVE
jgi:hypothetical protein